MLVPAHAIGSEPVAPLRFPEIGEQVGVATTNVELTSKQLEFLLVTIKNSLFKGEYVEICYNVTLKLQEEYQKLTKK